jgi:hypothetical protein
MITNNILGNNLGGQIRRVNRTSLGNLFNFCLPALLWMALILLLIGLPGYSFPKNELISTDKFIHFGLFFIQTMLWMQAFRKQNAIPMLRFEAGFYSLLIGILFSGITEILQGFIFIQRSADFMDYLANSAGVLGGWWFFKLFIQK